MCQEPLLSGETANLLVHSGERWADMERNTKDLFQAKVQVMCHAASPELYLSMVTWA